MFSAPLKHEEHFVMTSKTSNTLYSPESAGYMAVRGFRGGIADNFLENISVQLQRLVVFLDQSTTLVLLIMEPGPLNNVQGSGPHLNKIELYN